MLPAIDRAALPATHLDNVYCNATRRIVPQADVADKLLRSRPGDFQHRRFPAPQISSTADFPSVAEISRQGQRALCTTQAPETQKPAVIG